MKREESLQIAICRYVRLQYPHVIFTSESSGIKLTMGQAVKAKKLRSSRGLPDLIILHPRGEYHGLCLELKDKSPYLKDGVTLSKDKHIQEQEELLTKLNGLGYAALFAVGFEKTKEIIDRYLNA